MPAHRIEFTKRDGIRFPLAIYWKKIDMNKPVISDKMYEFYEMMEAKYDNFRFTTQEQRNDFLAGLRRILEADETEIEFELKLYFVNYLASNIRCERFGIIPQVSLKI